MFALLQAGQLGSAQAQITTPQNANGIAIDLNQPVAITVTGATGYALWAQNNGMITGSTNNIVLSTPNSQAIVAQSGGRITLDGTGGTFTVNVTSNASSAAVYVVDANSRVDLTGATITAGPIGSSGLYGARVGNTAQLALTNSTINVSGNGPTGTGPIGISAEGASSTVLNNVTVNASTTVNGQALVGIQAMNGSTITGDTINLAIGSGGGSGSKIGLLSSGTGSRMTLSNVSITGTATDTSGQIVTAISARSGGHLTVNGGTISGAGIVTALSANLTGAVLDVTDMVISSAKSSAGNILVSAGNGGILNVTGGSITTSNAFGWIAVQAIVLNSTVNLTGTTINQVMGSNNTSGGYALNTYGAATINADGVTIVSSSLSAITRALGVYFDQTGGRINLTNGSSITVTGGAVNSNASYGVLVNGTNNIFTGSDSSITTNRLSEAAGLGVNALQVQAGGVAILTNMTLTANGTGSLGAVATGTGSQITMNAGTNITTTGANGYGLSIQSGATVNATGSSVHTQGAGAYALVISGAGTTNTATLADSTLRSDQAAAITVFSGVGNIAISGSGSTVTGNGSWLSVAAGATASITVASGATVNGIAVGASGGTANVALNSGAIWNIAGNSFLTNLSFDGGILHYTTGSVGLSVANAIQLNNGGGTFDTNGFDVEPAQSITGTGGLVKIGLGTLTFTANNTYTGGTTISAGTVQLGQGGTSGSVVGAILNNGKLIVNRSNAIALGGVISGSGSLEQIGSGTLLLSADNTYSGGTTISDGTLQLGNGGASGSVTGNILNNGALIFNRSDTHVFGGVISGSGSLEQIGSGTLIFNNTQTYGGGTSVTGGSLAIGDASHTDTVLTGGATVLATASRGAGSVPLAVLAGGGVSIASAGTFGGYGSVVGDVMNEGTLAIGAAMDALSGGGIGNFRITGNLTNDGRIVIGSNGAVGNRLTINGNYIGNGSVAMSTELGTDGSPSDLLVLSGAGHTASGTSSLIVTNVRGLGAFTDDNGILVISAINGATTQADAFFLGSPVVAGPYEYSLYHGARDGSDPNGWYLRNDNPNPPIPPEPPGPPSPPEPPIPMIPNYRAEVSLYSTVLSQAQIYGRTLIGSLHDRTSDLPPSAASPSYEERQVSCGTGLQNKTCIARVPAENADSIGWYSGAWGRLIAEHGSRSDGGGIYARDGAAFEYDIYAMQMGFNLLQREAADGSSDRAGVYIAFGQVNADVKHYNGAPIGTNSVDAQTLGAYWTHYGVSGWYTDAVVQATKYANDSLSRRGFRMKTDGYGLAASLEGGYAVRLGRGLTFEPQAQLVYQHVGFDNSFDSGARVRFKDADSLAGRVGIRLKKDWQSEGEQAPIMLTTWLTANVWHEFKGDNKTLFSSADGPIGFSSDLRGSWGEIQAGMSSRISNAASLFASGGYQFGFTGDRHAYSGRLGLRIDW